jgi:hypothetical protein
MVFSFTIMSMITNSLILIDLFLTLRNPFYPREKRAKKYQIAQILTFLIALGVIFHSEIKTVSSTIKLYSDQIRRANFDELIIYSFYKYSSKYYIGVTIFYVFLRIREKLIYE